MFKPFRSSDRDQLVADYIERQTAWGALVLRGAAVDGAKRDLRSATPGVLPKLADQFFPDATRLRIAGHFSTMIAVANLLGRYAVRSALPNANALIADRLDSIATFYEYGHDDILSFNEPVFTLPDILRIATPEAALAYFRRFMTISFATDIFTTEVQGRGFEMALSADPQVRKAVAKVIEERLETGQRISDAPREIDAIITATGVSVPEGYSRMLFRTSLMESYRRGSWDEFNDPDVATQFPVWMYSGIPDGRERQGPMPEHPDHHRWFGKYFERTTDFFDVRGNVAADICNCRCVMIPVLLRKWNRLREKGAVITKWSPSMAYAPA